jgi:opacity protein-like surface antigen
MKKQIFTLAIATLALSAGAAHAGDWRSNLYMKGGVGWNHANESEYTSGSTDFEEGYTVSGAIGYDFGAVRTELELAYRDNDVNDIYIGTTPQPNPGGDISSTAVMLNGYYDIPTGGAVTPYIGAGIGMAHVSANDFHVGTLSIGDETDDVFAYQGIAGANFAIDGGFSLFAEYKYFATSDVDINTTDSASYDNHSILAGFKYDFN